MQHSKVQVLEVKTDSATKKKKIQQRWEGCQITDLLLCQWAVPSTRRSNESRGALKRERERTFSSVSFLSSDKKMNFLKRRKKFLLETYMVSPGTRGNDKRKQPVLQFLRLLLWRRCNVFGDVILWYDCTACLVFECFKWLNMKRNSHAHAHAHQLGLSGEKETMKKKKAEW